MGETIGGSIRWGAVYGTIGAFVSASCMSLFWAASSHRPSDMAVLMILWVPGVTIAGGVACTALFGIIGAIMSLEPGGIKPSTLSYAALAFVLTLGAVILPFASWIAGGWLRAIHGAQGVYFLLPTGLLPVTIVGFLVGRKMENAAGR